MANKIRADNDGPNKTCPRCKQSKSREKEWYRYGQAAYCIECTREYNKLRHKTDPLNRQARGIQGAKSIAPYIQDPYVTRRLYQDSYETLDEIVSRHPEFLGCWVDLYTTFALIYHDDKVWRVNNPTWGINGYALDDIPYELLPLSMDDALRYGKTESHIQFTIEKRNRPSAEELNAVEAS